MGNVVRRWLSSVLVAAVAASVLGAVSPVPSRASADPGAGAVPAQLPDDGSALAAAIRSGIRIEVAGRRSETTQVFANPDGTLTLEQHTSPVRVRRGGGSWTAIDTRVSRGADGVATPAATVVDMRFPAGGSGSSVWMSTNGRELAMGLPWHLPAPELDGSRAIYKAVLPGVDLVLTARPDGFSEVLVVHSREAAANPALRTLRFGLSTIGLRLRGEDGGFVAEDPASGAVVFSSAAPLMWDSAGGSTREVDWPVHGDRVAPMKTTLSDAELAVQPDRTLLDDPAAVFPVYLDPGVSGSRNEWAMISSGFPAQTYYNFGGDQGVGLCDVQDDGNCVRDQVKRIAWEFGISSAVHGTRVLKATFAAYETSAYNCTAREVQLWRVGALSSGTTWNNHAGTWGRHLSTVNVARDPGCANKPAFVEFDATAGAQEFATNRWPGLTLGLRATNEGTMSLGWKRFRNDATLSVTYNSAPNPPASPDTAGKGCAAGAAAPFVGDSTPSLTARVSDPDGDVDLIAEFAWDRWNTSLNGWERVAHVQKTNLASGTNAVLTLGVDTGTGSALEHGRRYRWTVLVIDPFPGGSDVSGWMNPWCDFEVDTVGPDKVPEVSSPVYVQDGNYHGGIGLTADFTFDPDGVADVAGYLWGWADPPTTLAAALAVGTALTLPLTPPPPDPAKPTVFGQLTLFVRSVDRAGNPGPRKDYNFLIDSASDPVGQWDLADPVGSTSLVDSSGYGHPATASGATLGTASRLLSGPGKAAPTAAVFNGSTSYATTGTPVLDTSKSFTVAAWVRPDVNSNGWRAIVAATGGQNSSFFLRRDPDNKVHFTVVATATWTQAVSISTTRAGVWTHLVGVYDAGAHQAHLYVNGVREATTDVPEVYNASGALEIGRAWWAGTWAYHPNWHGAMAGVKVWDRVLFEPEVAPMAATLVGSWRLDGHGGDASGWGRSVTPTDVSWVANRAGVASRAGAFNGTTSQAPTAGPAVRTDQSYTVAGWVRLASKSQSMSVVGQDGARASGFVIGYEPGPDRLGFVMYSADVDNPIYTAVWSTAAPQVGTWTHLAAVHDATTGQMRLYVNGVLAGGVAYGTAWHATGPLVMGRFRYNGAPRNFFPGSLDDMRVYAGALPDSMIDGLYRL